ncbi:flagellar hook-length control protein [Bdellovibrio bacteriovorus W]|nr:flagellar hook-length control protein [Bdellovibrio bacteriovorus W]
MSSPEKNMANKDIKSSESEVSFDQALKDRVNIKSEPKKSTASGQKSAKAESGSEERAQVEKPLTGKVNKRASTGREKAIEDFMDSFESEFKISPTRIVEAMAQLSDVELLQEPEITAEAVIDQLHLSEDESAKAQAMYSSLLVRLQDPSLNQAPEVLEVPKVIDAPVNTLSQRMGISESQALERALQAQDRLAVRGSAVDQLNQKFWKKGSEEKPMMDEAMTPPMAMKPSVLSEKTLSLDDLPPHIRGQMQEASLSPEMMGRILKSIESSQERTPSLGLDDSFTSMIEAPEAFEPKLASDRDLEMNSYEGAEENDLFAQLANENSANFQSEGEGSSEGQAESHSHADKKIQFKTRHQREDVSVLGNHLHEGFELTNPTAPVSAATATPLTQAEKAEAVQKLMNQAQILATKGGGEMKVQLNAEGLGAVQLKVAMQDGKLQLHMAAESSEAKSLIESSLAELKTSLAAQKLSVENVKIDVVNATTATDAGMQNQAQFNDQQQRDQTRQFWNRFNESFGSQGRKESFTEMTGVRGYGRQERDPLQPINSSQPARKVEGKGKGLNLVA